MQFSILTIVVLMTTSTFADTTQTCTPSMLTSVGQDCLFEQTRSTNVATRDIYHKGISLMAYDIANLSMNTCEKAKIAVQVRSSWKMTVRKNSSFIERLIEKIFDSRPSVSFESLRKKKSCDQIIISSMKTNKFVDNLFKTFKW